MEQAPIIIFAYKRPDKLREVLLSLAANEGASTSRLVIQCDGPKPGASGADKRSIEEVGTVAANAAGFASVEVVRSQVNKGLARSVIEGVTTMVNTYGRVIVVEDDVLLSTYFLRFMNDALERYKDDDRVCSIGSWNYFADPARLSDNFFLRYPDSIAWATWKRSWDRFEQDGEVLWEQLGAKGLRDALDADGRIPYFRPMLQQQMEGKIDSWAIRWTASCVLHGQVNLFPRVALSKHVGFGEGATHETGEVDYNKDLQLSRSPIDLSELEVKETPEAFEQWCSYVTRNFNKGGREPLKTQVWRALPGGLKQWYARRRSPAEGHPGSLAFEPVSRVFGIDRGKPVDRHYIEQFLHANRKLITGNVLEIGDAQYTDKFGSAGVRSEVLRYAGEAGPGVRIGDLTRHDGLPSGEIDAFICTQTLNFIFEVQQAIRGIHHALRPGGHALVTLAGLVQISRYDDDRWGDFWRFTPRSAQRSFEEVFGKGNVQVVSYGNSYAAACLMKGFATEECDKALLDRADEDYPVVITVLARKRI